jgi:hypothetical protein
MPAENTKERDFTGNCTLPAVWPFLLVPGFSADAPSRRAAGYITGFSFPDSFILFRWKTVTVSS